MDTDKRSAITVRISVTEIGAIAVCIDNQLVAELAPTRWRLGTIHSIVEKALRQWLTEVDK